MIERQLDEDHVYVISKVVVQNGNFGSVSSTMFRHFTFAKDVFEQMCKNVLQEENLGLKLFEDTVKDYGTFEVFNLEVFESKKEYYIILEEDIVN